MAEIGDLVPIDDNNTGRWPEGMPPSQVNDAGRADEGILSRWHRDTNGSLTSTGTSTAYDLTTNQSLTAYYNGLEISFKAHVACGDSPTLQLGTLGAANIVSPDGIELKSNDIASGSLVNVIYESSKWQVMNVPAASQIVFKGDNTAPRGYIDGFIISLPGGATPDNDHDRKISPGKCRDSTDQVVVSLPSELTKRIDAAFAKGDAQGGLFTGAVALNTSYHYCLISENSSGDVDWGWDTDPGGANTPTGWTFERRLGSIKTDGAANLPSITQYTGGYFSLDAHATQTLTSVSTTTTPSTHVLDAVPTGVNLRVRGTLLAFRENNVNNAGIFDFNVTSIIQTASYNVGIIAGGSGETTQAVGEWLAWCSTSAEIKAGRDQGLTHQVVVHGWYDPRGSE